VYETGARIRLAPARRTRILTEAPTVVGAFVVCGHEPRLTRHG